MFGLNFILKFEKANYSILMSFISVILISIFYDSSVRVKSYYKNYQKKFKISK